MVESVEGVDLVNDVLYRLPARSLPPQLLGIRVVPSEKLVGPATNHRANIKIAGPSEELPQHGSRLTQDVPLGDQTRRISHHAQARVMRAGHADIAQRAPSQRSEIALHPRLRHVTGREVPARPRQDEVDVAVVDEPDVDGVPAGIVVGGDASQVGLHNEGLVGAAGLQIEVVGGCAERVGDVGGRVGFCNEEALFPFDVDCGGCAGFDDVGEVPVYLVAGLVALFPVVGSAVDEVYAATLTHC